MKTIILSALIIFYIVIILFNFSSLEGFTPNDSNIFARNISNKSSNVLSNSSTSTSIP
jgi:hypothetical protein